MKQVQGMLLSEPSTSFKTFPELVFYKFIL